MNAPKFGLNQTVKWVSDPSYCGKVIAIHTHDTPVPEGHHKPAYALEWNYLILLGKPSNPEKAKAMATQMWILEDKLETLDLS